MEITISLSRKSNLKLWNQPILDAVRDAYPDADVYVRQSTSTLGSAWVDIYVDDDRDTSVVEDKVNAIVEAIYADKQAV